MAARGVYKEHIFDGGRANLDSYLGDDMKHSVPLQTATSEVFVSTTAYRHTQ